MIAPVSVGMLRVVVLSLFLATELDACRAVDHAVLIPTDVADVAKEADATVVSDATEVTGFFDMPCVPVAVATVKGVIGTVTELPGVTGVAVLLGWLVVRSSVTKPLV